MADDSEAERASARQALSRAGYQVVEAIDGQHALEVFARERPDLVMLDVVMPRLTGLETCRILKAKNQGVYLPVIMVSTRNSVNARVEGLRSGADDYLGKPYDVEELQARVEALLRTRRVLDEDAGESGARSRSENYLERLEEEFDRAERYSDPLACLRVELDRFDDLSPAQAKATVERLRVIIESSIRKIDHVFRRDERGYILVLPNTHFPGALAVAERVWKDVRTATRDASTSHSVSIGISFYPNRETNTLADLLELVDAALQRAQGDGGGKICLYQHQGYLYAPQ